jgi:cellulose synthase/poly-beta-1,6-N-acetylglucosamine synthase-like glycosyltransferase
MQDTKSSNFFLFGRIIIDLKYLLTTFIVALAMRCGLFKHLTEMGILPLWHRILNFFDEVIWVSSMLNGSLGSVARRVVNWSGNFRNSIDIATWLFYSIEYLRVADFAPIWPLIPSNQFLNGEFGSWKFFAKSLRLSWLIDDKTFYISLL